MTHLGLIKKNPVLTYEEFSKYWRTKHAYAVVPYFMNRGFQYYAQIHFPKVTAKVTDPALAAEIGTFSGGVELIQAGDPASAATETQPEWMKAYYEEVIIADERKFLDGAALDHLKWVDTDSIEGEKLVVVEGGKVKIDVPDEYWAVWEEYKKRGEAESK